MSEDDPPMPNGKSDRPSSSSAAKSAKALKAAKSRSRGSSQSPVKDRHIPWLSLGAGLLVIALIAAIAAFLVPKYEARSEAERYVPTATNTDPSSKIDGVVKVDYPAGLHVSATQRVAYDKKPPFGGPHDQVWAACVGNVYPKAIRTENGVHALEHGAVWITYNPDKLSTDQVQTLASKVEGQPYMFMSPYPGMDSNFSLQSWGHQLKLTDVNDHRAANFISALRQNSNTYPEVGASCDAGTPTLFDPANPPAFDPTPPGAGAIPMDGKGLTPQLTNGQEQPPTGGAAATSAPAAVPPMTTTGGN
jgi:Protein of unknown function (DUF3105)